MLVEPDRRPHRRTVRRMLLVLGDQLDDRSDVFAELNPETDSIVMMEVDEEATYVRQHQHRLVLFFSAMRHFRDRLLQQGWTVDYSEVDDPDNRGCFRDEITRRIAELDVDELVVRQPGDHRVLEQIRDACDVFETTLRIVEDDHFICTLDDFAHWRKGRKSVVLEHFYRWMRKRHNVLMDGNEPVSGRWNYDADNRESWKEGTTVPRPPVHEHDAITREVIALVTERYADHPGDATTFALPVTRKEALADLRAFIDTRLVLFGRFQDAMPENEPFVFHSRLSAAINLHLLDPREVIEAAIACDAAPLAAVEGFVRQILGWRELVRGLYWVEMPEYARLNELGAKQPVPEAYWSGDTEMRCVEDSMRNVIDNAYAHHIQRLMVLGNYALLLGVDPYELHEWHMAMYADAVDWASLPNVLGMSQYADGGLVGTKPYAATGKYISRMGTYCKSCRFDPRLRVGDDACPMTTLYWDFLFRNHKQLSTNHRMRMQLKNLDRIEKDEEQAIRKQARSLRVYG